MSWVDQRHIILPRIGVLTLAEPLPEFGWVKEVRAVRRGRSLVRRARLRERTHVARIHLRWPGDRRGRGHQDTGLHQRRYPISQPPMAQTDRKETPTHQQGYRSQHQTEPQHQNQTQASGSTTSAPSCTTSRSINGQTHHRQTASAIAKSAGVVVVESLNVAGMMRNHRLSKALSDAGLGHSCANWNGSAPNTALCCSKPDVGSPAPNYAPNADTQPDQRLDLSVRTYRCEICDWDKDRDLNAAINLENVAPALWATLIGRGGDVSPAQARLLPLKRLLGPTALLPTATPRETRR